MQKDEIVESPAECWMSKFLEVGTYRVFADK